MDYQVLARKWRPRNFTTLLGQETLVKTLTHAFSQNRIHHAYLFTGTHGVGKTSVARIVAKCLNCETGITASPCENCHACINIDKGTFLDLIEVDAASRTRVEDTRDLLDNVQYAPTQGRYKIYLIDEVHMLSGHSFNALLKTLEEPPPQVIFLLATTDPDRLPKTILSRCLQFHLNNIDQEAICKQIEIILNTEAIPYDKTAVERIAYQANGSMRDALTLLDQAIAHGQGELKEHTVKTLLGSIDHDDMILFLEAIQEQNSEKLFEGLTQLQQYGCNYTQACDALIGLLHQLSMMQILPQLKHPFYTQETQRIEALSQTFSPDTLQLLYQIALIGRRDLNLAPQSKMGFEMMLIRLFAFRPSDLTPKQTEPPKKTTEIPEPKKATPFSSPKTKPHSEKLGASQDPWSQLLPSLKLSGMAQMLAQHCTLIQQTENQLDLLLSPQQQPLLTPNTQARLTQALCEHFRKTLKVTIKTGNTDSKTPAEQKQKAIKEKQDALVNTLKQDENIQSLLETFNTDLHPNAIQEN